MNVILYSTTDDSRRVYKDIALVAELDSVILKNDVDMLSPIFIFDYNNEIDFNYIYVQKFARFYFVENIEFLTAHRIAVHCRVDVLQSFASEILELECIIDKQEKTKDANKYLDDGSYRVDSRLNNTAIVFPSGLPDSGEYILIVAG